MGGERASVIAGYVLLTNLVGFAAVWCGCPTVIDPPSISSPIATSVA